MDRKIEYGTESDVTITIASLAPSSTLLAGRESALIDNSSNKFLDYLVSGKITTNGTITAGGRVELWAIASFDDGTAWPDAFTGADAARTITSANIKSSVCRLIAAMEVAAAGACFFAGESLAARFGGVCPKKFSLFLTHNTHASNALDATPGNHQIRLLPVYETVN